ncbi:hypothetical protein HU200_056082 [Digitaria exilis]|uniref:Tyrosinase copper-binding domain-containing protein n=1 Tax=Digitaria exilis TaxID=1010633 RepID=A0A835E410_9POAL|nr:hypothetical protein HU200_056082 [Digitaria exilis]CAB3480246.1 unnamed protein product [Digitaria exilis]
MNGCMASALVAAATTPATAKSPACPSKKTSITNLRARAVSCRATGRSSDDLLWLPRREILTGLGGVAAGLVGYQSFVSSVANAAEEVAGEKCTKPDPVTDSLIGCMDPTTPCPPKPKVPVLDFTPESKVKRIRRPVHLLDREYQEKYKEAVAKMKALPASNPLSFTAQAAIHQAYCDHHYHYDPDKKNVDFDVHNSWLFAPWHRMYIYFYEKALGQLIGDDTFGLPFWNWDTPAGMVVPALFKDTFANPLYDRNRNPDHLDTVANLDFLNNNKSTPVAFNGPHDKAYEVAIYKNLATVHQQQLRGAGCARSFLGEKLCTDNISKQGQGSLESMAHTALHVWVGRQGGGTSCTGGVVDFKGDIKCANDMGFLGSAGRDPLFYSHHANVDRMWHIWSTKLGGEGFKDPEWLNTSFVFYDDVDNPHPVRIKFRDVIDTKNLGYTYDAEADKDLPWKDCQLTSLVPHTKGAGGAMNKLRKAVIKAAVFPVTVTKNNVIEVPSVVVPAKKEGQPRVLVIQGFEYDPNVANKFDVALNVPKDSALDVGPQNFEFAGSFAVVPASGLAGEKVKGGVTFSVEECLKDIKAADDSTVDVIIVPRTEGEIRINSAPTIQS